MNVYFENKTNLFHERNHITIFLEGGNEVCEFPSLS